MIKLLCINFDGCDGFLTIDKVYYGVTIITSDESKERDLIKQSRYVITDDTGNESQYYTWRFKTFEKIIDEKINILLN